MTEPLVSFTPEQFDRLVEAVANGGRREGVEAKGAVGIAGVPVVGVGCGDAGMGPMASSVYAYLAAGSPRLALAKAMGMPFAPWMCNVRAVFGDTSVANVPEVGGDTRITQDVVVESMLVRVENQSTTANQNQFQSQSDFYYNFQSCIEATLDITGTPRYPVAPRFMPIASLCDAFNGDSRPGAGWILTYTNQFKMSFYAKVTIPVAPIEVIVTFRTSTPIWDALVEMTNREAIYRLQQPDIGLVLPEAYVNRCCR